MSDTLRKHLRQKPARRKESYPVKTLEARMIGDALSAVGGNKTKAARLLGMSREGLRKKIRRYTGDKDHEDE